jgi:peptidoglycan LD-endopeptidase LytH
MKFLVRVSIAIMVLSVGAFVLPRPAARVVGGDALAQPVPTPTVPGVLPEPSPSPSKPPGGGGGGGGGNKPGGGGNKPGGGGNKPGGGDVPGDPDGPRKGRKKGRGPGNGKGGGLGLVVPNLNYNRIPGAFSTDNLVAAAGRLQALGWSEERVRRAVYPPFIVAGRANWIDTWGAPRYGPGPIVRTHEGQDVFCDFGDPVLASEDGRVEFDNQQLGGKIARLRRPDGSYWYYAHLKGFNEKLANGSRVARGDVIGFCGNSGNAISTPPHVHFGWYGGGAKNPMLTLIDWLREAEAAAQGLVGRATGERIEKIDSLTAARRFGDAFAPDLSELEISGESLLASGSSPATGAFAVAEAALQMALSSNSGPAPSPAAASSRFRLVAPDGDHAGDS